LYNLGPLDKAMSKWGKFNMFIAQCTPLVFSKQVKSNNYPLLVP
jgi:hypothetical protein